MSEAKRKLGGLLVGIGAFLALVCCAAPWLVGGLLVALGLGFILKNALLIALTVVGVILVLAGLALRRNQAKEKGSSDQAKEKGSSG